MGDPRKTRRKYKTPTHMWQKARIDEEKALLKEYGLKNKKELWKMRSIQRFYKLQAKKLIAAHGEQADKEKALLLTKLQKYGFSQAGATLSSVLGLTLRDILERRLQTQLYKRNMARSMKQARQFIIHQHVTLNGEKLNMPSFLVPIGDHIEIGFSPASTLADLEHPERVIRSASEARKEKAEEEKKEGGAKESPKPAAKEQQALLVEK
ncbi:30S ribosomal protein S4 [Candidatus Woesearchaeota archaeon]|nr:30S ribosomal protein S4 [Candidatus Woesearchaeota archaeon]